MALYVMGWGQRYFVFAVWQASGEGGGGWIMECGDCLVDFVVVAVSCAGCSASAAKAEQLLDFWWPE